MHKLVYLVALAWGVSLYAQKPDIEALKKEYPGESKIYLNYKCDIDIRMDGDSLRTTMRNYEEGLCLGQNAILNADQSVSYSWTHKLKSLKAYTVVPGRIGNRTYRVDKFDTTDFGSSYVFYDDVREINFAFPKLEEGARTILDYTYNITEPRLLNSFHFNNYIPVENAELTVTAPLNVSIGYRLFNCDSINVKFEQKAEGNKVTYSWKAVKVRKLNPEPNAPAIAYYAAHMFVYVKEYKVKDKVIHVLSGPEQLYAWYYNMVSGINKETPPEMVALIDSLTRNAGSELEKVKKIYSWVQDHIKYIAFEAGRGGFVPRDASDVFAKRYGDCKDMASLINKMLSIAGIQSHLTWIGARNLPYTYSQLPTPACDNHMICTYIHNDKFYFLDATAGVHPFSYPSEMIQGKEALIAFGPNDFKIIKVPEVSSTLNLKTDTLRIKLDGKKVTGTGISYFRGYPRVDLYRQITGKDKTEQTTFLKNYFAKGNNKFLIDNFEIENLENRDDDLVIKYHFNVGDYAQSAGDEIFLNMNMDKTNLGETLKNTRKVAFESDYKTQVIHHVILEIPEGYKLSYVPENSEFDNALFNYKIDYKPENKSIQLTQKIDTDFLLLSPQQFPQWNNMIESLKGAYKSTIILKKER